MEQLALFDEKETLQRVNRTKRKGGSQNPIVFRDYESFVAKFTDNPKTTDDCYTPPDVYEAVVRYVGTITDLTGKAILRPFYPGGDFENAEYPDDGVVIDNPPFSLSTKIVRFFLAHGIPFFLFGNGMTIMQACKYGATAVITGCGIRFHNGAEVAVNFTTNLLPDIMCITAPTLTADIERCPSQKQKADLPVYEYPEELLSVSTMQTIAAGGVDFAVRRCEAACTDTLDNHPNGNGGLFGTHLFISTAKAKAKATAKAKAKAKIPVQLSEAERRIVDSLPCFSDFD